MIRAHQSLILRMHLAHESVYNFRHNHGVTQIPVRRVCGCVCVLWSYLFRVFVSISFNQAIFREKGISLWLQRLFSLRFLFLSPAYTVLFWILYTVFLCLLLVKFIFCCCIKASPNMVLRDALNSNERQFVFTSFFDGSFYSIHDSLFSEMSSCFPHFAPFFLHPYETKYVNTSKRERKKIAM